MPLALLFVGMLFLSAAPAEALSNAARYLIDEQIAEACEGYDGGGTIDLDYVLEHDLTGNGRADLIISYEGIDCDGWEPCGLLCPINIYVRRGQLLEYEEAVLGRGVSVGSGEVPTIHMVGQGARPTALRWDGQAFQWQ